jgi:hydroxymethylpyrimidine/phosphomethylpyrimidine kinase
MKIALTIAGSDSGGGAGLQADLRTFAAFGLHGTSAITAVTAQSSTEVAAWAALEPAMVVQQIETVASDMPLAAAKTGMLGTPDIARAVAACVRRLRLPFLVVDPVLAASGGERLLEADAGAGALDSLFEIATVVTPNLAEAAELLGRPVHGLVEMREAARALANRCGAAVVIKGGHLQGDAVDVFFDGRQMMELRGPRIDTRHTHGTGCTFSAAIAAALALGRPLPEAVRGAKEYVAAALRAGYPTGKGPGALDPLHAVRASLEPT